MADIGDRVQVVSSKVGQVAREGLVTGVNGAMLRIRWSTGEETTVVPAVGSITVVSRATGRAQVARAGRAATPGPAKAAKAAKATKASKAAKPAKTTKAPKAAKATKAARKSPR